MDTFQHMRKLYLASSDQIAEPEDASGYAAKNECTSLDQIVKIFKANEAALRSCQAYPNCHSCMEAGQYGHCNIDFHIDAPSKLLLLSLKNCFPDDEDEDGDHMEWSTVRVFAEKAADLVSIIGHALENVPEETLDDFSLALSNQTPSLKAQELNGVHLSKETTRLLGNILVHSSSLEKFHFA
jgi:hypothetical protein